MRRDLGRVPADLAATITLVLAANLVVLVPALRSTLLRIPLGLALVLLAPGYATVAGVFPRNSIRSRAEGRSNAEESDVTKRRTITGAERLALSVTVSALLTSVAGIGLTLASVPLELLPIVLAVSVPTVGASVVAVRRRERLTPEAEPILAPNTFHWRSLSRSEGTDRGGRLLDGVLVVLVLVAVVGVGYAAVGPAAEDEYTELALLTENESGTLVADDYPKTLEADESRNLTVAIGNDEGRTVDYTVVVQLQYVAESSGAGTDRDDTTDPAADAVRIEERVEYDRYAARVQAGDTWRRPHSISISRPGERVRLVYLLFRDDVPRSPTIATADESVHLWLTTSE